MQEKEIDPKSTEAHAEPHPAEFDDVVHVPKGQSKLRFFILLSLTILILLIFTVGSEIMQSVETRGKDADDFVTWNDPSTGPVRIAWREFQPEMIALEDFYRVQGVRARTLTDADATAAMLLNDRLAQDAGIEVSNEELGKAILEGDPRVMPRGFFSAEIYKASCQQAGVAPATFENVLRRMLRIARYHQMVMTIAAVATPEDLEKAWKERHQEYAFDYVELPTASLDAEVEAALPDDAALDAWYVSLPNRMQLFSALEVPAKFSAEIVGFPISGELKAEGLLAKFPRAADRDVEAEAKVYYESVRDRRFRRATPLEGEGLDELTRLYQPYEEVAELAKREAPIYNALRDWLVDVSKRLEGGATVDLQQEAADFGVSYSSDDVLRTNAEWSALGGVHGPFLTAALAGANPLNKLTASVECEAGGFAFGRIKVQQPPSLPPLVEVKDTVLAEWKKSKRSELAKAKLEAIRATFPVPAPEPSDDPKQPPKPRQPSADQATFQAAVQAAGLTVSRRDFAERTPSKFAPRPTKTAADEYFETAFTVYTLAENEVTIPELDRTGTHAYLVRFDKKRDPETVKITPGEYESLKMFAEFQAFQRYMTSASSVETLSKRYGLTVRGSQKAPPPTP
ncbi:MAG: SurA N-terminal domain-containing protein [Planctomycetes bacterium]|nr:SurA N-terminal domain-containing protein [Planctomycetota bacterium]